LEQQLYGVMDDICQLVDAIPLQELQSLSCAKQLLQHRDRRYASAGAVAAPCPVPSGVVPAGVSVALKRGRGRVFYKA